MKKNVSDIIVALSVILCSAALLGALVAATMGNPFASPHLRFSIDFPDISGISTATDVRYGGAVVGQVARLEILPMKDRLDPDHIIRTHVDITQEIEIPKDLSIRITSHSMLGERYISLNRVGQGEDYLEEGARLKADGATSMMEDFIPGSGDMIANADKLLAELVVLVDKLNNGPEGESIAATLGNVESASSDLKDITASVKEALDGDEETPGMRRRMENSMANLERITGEIDTLLQGTEEDPGLSDRATAIAGNVEAFSAELNLLFEGKDGEPGLDQRLYAITDEVQTLLSGPPGQPEEAMRAQISELTGKMDSLMDEMQVLVVWGQYITGTLAEKPNRIIFGNEPNAVPTKDQLLQYIQEAGDSYPVVIRENNPQGVPMDQMPALDDQPVEGDPNDPKNFKLFKFLNKDGDE